VKAWIEATIQGTRVSRWIGEFSDTKNLVRHIVVQTDQTTELRVLVRQHWTDAELVRQKSKVTYSTYWFYR